MSNNDEISQQISTEGDGMPCLWPARCVRVSAGDCSRAGLRANVIEQPGNEPERLCARKSTPVSAGIRDVVHENYNCAD